MCSRARLFRMAFRLVVLALIPSLTAFPGAAEASFFAHKELAARMEKIKTIGLLPPNIRIYELSTGGIMELKEDWSAAGKANVARAISEALGARLVEIDVDSLDNAAKTELDEVRTLYPHVEGSFLAHVDGPDAFPGKKENFDYTLGPMEKLLATLGVDALLFVSAMERISTGGRKAVAALGLLGGVVFKPGGAGMDAGLVDATGQVLWYRFQGSAFGGGFREFQGARAFTAETLSGFPGVAKGDAR